MSYANPEDQRRASRAHYEANKEELKRKAAERGKIHRKKARDLTRQTKECPCADCGIQYPYYVMQFDHAPGGKSFTIGRYSTKSISLKRLAEEIAKCDVVCANCHAERTFQRAYGSDVGDVLAA